MGILAMRSYLGRSVGRSVGPVIMARLPFVRVQWRIKDRFSPWWGSRGLASLRMLRFYPGARATETPPGSATGRVFSVMLTE